MAKLSKKFLFFPVFTLCFLIFAFGFSKPALAACPAGKCPQQQCGTICDPDCWYDCWTVCVPCATPPPGGGERGCFLPGTKVLITDERGKWRRKNIEEVQLGETVVSFMVDGKINTQKVLQKLVHESSKGYLIPQGDSHLSGDCHLTDFSVSGGAYVSQRRHVQLSQGDPGLGNQRPRGCLCASAGTDGRG